MFNYYIIYYYFFIIKDTILITKRNSSSMKTVYNFWTIAFCFDTNKILFKTKRNEYYAMQDIREMLWACWQKQRLSIVFQPVRMAVPHTVCSHVTVLTLHCLPACMYSSSHCVFPCNCADPALSSSLYVWQFLALCVSM